MHRMSLEGMGSDLSCRPHLSASLWQEEVRDGEGRCQLLSPNADLSRGLASASQVSGFFLVASGGWGVRQERWGLAWG